ncbi:MAG: hypothetical protein UH229_03720, partial [Lachnospiraceae bacterium]|nr:hypothetical protein [Lachnospiraceae bacterium]
MAVDIGPKIGIEGEREFRQQIAQTNQALKTLAAEGKAVSSAFYEEADGDETLYMGFDNVADICRYLGW